MRYTVEDLYKMVEQVVGTTTNTVDDASRTIIVAQLPDGHDAFLRSSAGGTADLPFVCLDGTAEVRNEHAVDRLLEAWNAFQRGSLKEHYAHVAPQNRKERRAQEARAARDARRKPKRTHFKGF